MNYEISKEQLANLIKNIKNSPFSPEELANELISVGVTHPTVAMSQSIQETGRWGSPIFKQNNNCFGMKFPSVRPTVATGQSRGHAMYKNWRDSVKDYKMWQDFYSEMRQKKGKKPITSMSEEEYYNFLDNLYCPPPDCASGSYVRSLRALSSEAKKFFTNTIKGKTQFLLKKLQKLWDDFFSND